MGLMDYKSRVFGCIILSLGTFPARSVQMPRLVCRMAASRTMI